MRQCALTGNRYLAQATCPKPRWPPLPYQLSSHAHILVNVCCHIVIAYEDFCNIVLFQSPNIINVIKTAFGLGSQVPNSLIIARSHLCPDSSEYHQARKLLSNKNSSLQAALYESPPRQGIVFKQLSTRGPTQSYPGGNPRVLQVESVLIPTS